MNDPIRRILLPVLLILPLVLLAGCRTYATPIPPGEIAGHPLKTINDAFIKAVEDAHADPDITWHSGWMGNTLVNALGGNNKGLCTDWQELIYNAVAPVARKHGWEATGITVDENNRWEHHAVVIYDPRKVRWENLLEKPDGAYVLDGWLRGRPDTYPLGLWIRTELDNHGIVQLEDLAAEHERAKAGDVTNPMPQHQS
ncbi:MAG TPA: hypothetical protein VK176_15260 [Phycisphaerales bacterium]|nr:hypothetical protein [Phycisphaerales bacterium]